MDQSDWLHKLPRVRQTFTYPAVDSEFSLLGHDHPSSLNRVCREKILTTHVIVMDSDCFPISESWINSLINKLATADCVLAGDRRANGLTHPCFMAIPARALGSVDFSAGVEIGVDTGRLVGFQLSTAGLRVNILQPETGFDGYTGDLYLEGTILHVGSRSFPSSKDSRLISQVDHQQAKIIRRYVQGDRFHLNLQDKFRLIWTRIWRISKSKVRSAC